MTYRELVLDIIKNANLDEKVMVLVGKRSPTSGSTQYMKQVPIEYARLCSGLTGIRIDMAEIEMAEPITNF